MMDDLLSQEEIEALLSGAASANADGGDKSIDDVLSSEEQDALGEIGNITFGSSATALSKLLNQKVEITTPSVSYIKREDLLNEFQEPFVAVQVGYTEALEGANLLVIEIGDASIIADLMMGGDGSNKKDELNEIELSAVQEAMNQMMGSAATSLSTMISAMVDITPPSVKVIDIDSGGGQDLIPNEEAFIRVSFELKVGDLIDSYIMQLIAPNFAKNLLGKLHSIGSDTTDSIMEESQASPSMPPKVEETPPAPALPPQTDTSAEQMNMAQQQPMYQQPMYQQPMYQQPMYQQPMYQQPAPPQQPVNVQPATFATFQPEPLGQAEARNLSMLMDISLNVTVELGRTKKTVKEILEFGHGSIIELDRLAGEPIDILINNRPIAKAEVVVIEENFGVRIIEILSPTDRLNQLK